MKTFIFLILFFIPFVFSQWGQCDPRTYGNAGDSCSAAQNSTRVCKQYLSCKDGRCSTSIVGSRCKVPDDCFLSRRTQGMITCIKDTCVKMKYNGERCIDNEQCFGQKCENGWCVGLKEGDACNPTQNVQCDRGLYCSLQTSTCTRQKLLGDNCEDYVSERAGRNYNVICPGGSVCMAVAGSDKRCRKYGYVQENGACNFDNECAGFMTCNRNQVCSQNVWSWNQGCPGAPKNCSFVDGESCICGQNGQTNSCQKTSAGRIECNYPYYATEIRNCGERNNCPYDSNYQFFSNYYDVFPQAETCMSQNCGSIIREYFCCLGDGYDHLSASWLHSAPLSCSTSNPVVTAFVVLLFLFAFASIIVTIIVIVVIVIKRKNAENFQRLE